MTDAERLDDPLATPTRSDDRHREAPVSLDCELAQKYRRRLLVLPAEYRATHGEEMLEVFLAAAHDADPENADLTFRLGSPGWRETWSLVALALRLRWSAPAAGSSYADRAAGLRLFTSAAVVLLAAGSLVHTVSAIWFLISPPTDWAAISRGVSPWQQIFPTDDWWVLAQSWVHLVWIAVLVLVGRGGWGALRTATWLAAIPSTVLATRIVIDVIRAGGIGRFPFADWFTIWFIVDLVAVAGLAAAAGYARSAPGASAPRQGHSRSDLRPRPSAAPSAGAEQGAALPTQAHHCDSAAAPAEQGGAWSAEFAQPGRMRRHLLAAPIVAAACIGCALLLLALHLPTSAALTLFPLMDDIGMWTLAAVAAAIVAALRRRRLDAPRATAYAVAWIAAIASLLQGATLPLWIDIVRYSEVPHATGGLTMAIAAFALDLVILTVALALSRHPRDSPFTPDSTHVSSVAQAHRALGDSWPYRLQTTLPASLVEVA